MIPYFQVCTRSTKPCTTLYPNAPPPPLLNSLKCLQHTLQIFKRCDIADHLYRQAKAKRAVPPGIGWLPWATADSKVVADNDPDTTTKSHSSSQEEKENQNKKKDGDGEVGRNGRAGAGAGAGANGGAGAAASSAPDVFGWDAKRGYGRESEEERFAREGDPARLLSDAVGFYRLAAQLEEGGGGTGRGQFSLGWMYQARVSGGFGV